MDDIKLNNANTSVEWKTQKINVSSKNNTLSESEITQNELIIKNAVKMIWSCDSNDSMFV